MSNLNSRYPRPMKSQSALMFLIPTSPYCPLFLKEQEEYKSMDRSDSQPLSYLKLCIKVFEEGTKGKVCRLETVGIVSPGGVQVAVYVDQVTIGREGQVSSYRKSQKFQIDSKVYERFYYDRAAEHGMDDVHIEVHPADRGKNPHRGVMISIGHAGDIRFNVEYKRAKKSASLAVERGSGLKDRLSGVLGSTMHGDIDYHISKSGGIVLPNGK